MSHYTSRVAFWLLWFYQDEYANYSCLLGGGHLIQTKLPVYARCTHISFGQLQRLHFSFFPEASFVCIQMVQQKPLIVLGLDWKCF